MAALLEPQLNFIRTFPCQAKDKIRLLIQKLVELSCHFRNSLGLLVPTVLTQSERTFIVVCGKRWTFYRSASECRSNQPMTTHDK